LAFLFLVRRAAAELAGNPTTRERREERERERERESGAPRRARNYKLILDS
jgi:hypothetical protein